MCHRHQGPSVSIAVVLFELGMQQPHVLLSYSSGGLTLLRVAIDRLDVALDEYAMRFLERTVGLSVSRLMQSITDQDLSQDPPLIDICYYGFSRSQFVNGDDLIWVPLYHLLPDQDHREPAATDSVKAAAHLSPVSDHDLDLLAAALNTLRRSLDRRPVIEEIEPVAFTLSYLQQRTEMLLGTSLHTQNFRRKILESGFLEPIDIAVAQSLGRPALLYQVRSSTRGATID